MPGHTQRRKYLSTLEKKKYSIEEAMNFFQSSPRTKFIESLDCDLMCLSHFIMYTLLGYYSPKYWYISFILSIIWEYSEEYMEKSNIKIISNFRNDIITNTLGLILGIIINSYY